MWVRYDVTGMFKYLELEKYRYQKISDTLDLLLAIFEFSAKIATASIL